MKKYLALALLLCALASMSNAQCFRKATKPVNNRCQDHVDKTWHDMGSSWRNSQCYDCTCDSCCTGYSTPQNFPDDCVSVLDLNACEYKVFKRDNPTVQCPIFSAPHLQNLAS
uniref:Beta-microseminoprotein-like n=1 Tax=Cyclopterus lumpus TaxID=8103 RepID=A0A8C2ZCF9_CYCLU